MDHGYEAHGGDEWSVERLCRGSVVFVDEAAEDVTALDVGEGAVREGSDVRPVRLRQVEASVRALLVVMRTVALGANGTSATAPAGSWRPDESQDASHYYPSQGLSLVASGDAAATRRLNATVPWKVAFGTKPGRGCLGHG